MAAPAWHELAYPAGNSQVSILSRLDHNSRYIPSMDEFVLPVMWMAYGSETYCAAAWVATRASNGMILDFMLLFLHDRRRFLECRDCVVSLSILGLLLVLGQKLAGEMNGGIKSSTRGFICIKLSACGLWTRLTQQHNYKPDLKEAPVFDCPVIMYPNT